MNKFLNTIAEEKDKFSFGESWRYSEDSLVAVLPILRDLEKKRGYLLLREPTDVSVSDTGQINRIRINNKGKKPVYIRMGELFTGKSQERMATRSYVVMPQEIVDIEVRCVHASKGIRSGEDMKPNGIAPSTFDSQLSNSSFRGRRVSQRDTWNTVGSISASFSTTLSDSTEGFVSPSMAFSDDLRSNLKKFSKQIDKILEKVPYFSNQVGLAMIGTNGVRGVEAFDLKQSWKVLKDDIVQKEGENIAEMKKDSPFEYKKERAVKVVKDVLKLDFEEKVLFKNKDCRIIGLNSEKYTGEITELNGEVIHFMIVRKKDK